MPPNFFLLGCRPASALANTHNVCFPAQHVLQSKNRLAHPTPLDHACTKPQHPMMGAAVLAALGAFGSAAPVSPKMGLEACRTCYSYSTYSRTLRQVPPPPTRAPFLFLSPQNRKVEGPIKKSTSFKTYQQLKNQTLGCQGLDFEAHVDNVWHRLSITLPHHPTFLLCNRSPSKIIFVTRSGP